ncbi:thaumatin-like protein [Mycena sanguinolenta]|nr:thaumatin-like protein [Mycena sanguinolenta]
MKIFLSLIGFSAVAVVSARNFTVKNSCSYTIFTDLNVGSATPDHPTGWEAPSGTKVSFSVPNDWTSGRIWGRTECDFSSNPGPTSCATGGCNGGLLCDPHTGTGVPPATLAEFTLSAGGSLTTVSLVDGFNIPIKVANNADCDVPSCSVNLNPDCPAPLQSDDSNGKAVGCNSACAANLDGHSADSPNCCSGSHDTPKTCPSSGVAYYDFFKDKCHDAYCYAYDDATALFHCDSSRGADYTIEFCP